MLQEAQSTDFSVKCVNPSALLSLITVRRAGASMLFRALGWGLEGGWGAGAEGGGAQGRWMRTGCGGKRGGEAERMKTSGEGDRRGGTEVWLREEERGGVEKGGARKRLRRGIGQKGARRTEKER